MPRTTIRQAVINRLDHLLYHAVKQHRYRRGLMGMSTSDIDIVLLQLRAASLKIKGCRYLPNTRGTYRKRCQKFDLYLEVNHDNQLTDREFRFNFRVTRECFWQLVELLKDHPIFQKSSDSRGPQQKPPSHQLLVLLKYYGCEGNAGSSIALGTFFGVGSGVIDYCKENALQALLALESRTVMWPNEEERRAIANRIKAQYFFPNCVGIIDGTLLPLAQRPLLHGENYLSRKRFYAIVMLVVCDDQCRMLYYHVGWPGSVHDNRVWRTCRMFRKCHKYFSPKEYHC